MVIIPYIKGLSERIRTELNKFNICTMFKPHNTLRNILVKPKDRTDKMNQAGIIYHIKCEDCSEDYIGETERMTRDSQNIGENIVWTNLVWQSILKVTSTVSTSRNIKG